MKKKLDQLNIRVSSLVSKLPDETDRSWLVTIYLSLKKAAALNYKDDSFSKLTKCNQDTILLKMKSLDTRRLSTTDKDWIAGYFFNNAMFRIVALAEIGLKILFEKKTKMKAPGDYGWLSQWYERTFTMKLDNIQFARRRVNKFKHEPRGKGKKKKFETMREGIDALKELLSLLEQI